MSDITLTYKGNTIATMDDSGTKTLKTSGKYCEGDISLTYVKSPSGITPQMFGMTKMDIVEITPASAINIASAEYTISHSLGVVPKLVMFYAYNTSRDLDGVGTAPCGVIQANPNGVSGYYQYTGAYMNRTWTSAGGTATESYFSIDSSNTGSGSTTTFGLKIGGWSGNLYPGITYNIILMA